MGLDGRKFVDKYKEQVSEMKRNFLEFMKGTRLELAEHNEPTAAMPEPAAMSEPGGADQRAIATKELEVQLNGKGYPVIPKEVTERLLSKTECERLIRAYMNRHYCE